MYILYFLYYDSAIEDESENKKIKIRGLYANTNTSENIMYGKFDIWRISSKI